MDSDHKQKMGTVLYLDIIIAMNDEKMLASLIQLARKQAYKLQIYQELDWFRKQKKCNVSLWSLAEATKNTTVIELIKSLNCFNL